MDRLFEIPAEWEEHWEGMPEFVQERDERPNGGSMRIYFRTDDDRRAFLKLIECPDVASNRGSAWYPFKAWSRDAYSEEFDPSKVQRQRYPVYIVSKGRWSAHAQGTTKWGAGLTYRALDELGIDYRIVVEPQECDRYAGYVDEQKILVLPFSELGQGSIPARNWIWDHAVQSGAKRHWILDDNIKCFARLNRNRNRIIKDENPLTACEEFVDRYANVGLAGLQNRGFADGKDPNIPPYRLNTRIYSCILVNHDLPFRWRGRYNEDTDLSIRVLKAGWVTVLFNAYLIHKVGTLLQGGGNTDELYAGDGRLKMAESLREQHPDIVIVTKKWGRPQHHVDYSQFRQQLRTGPVGEAES